MFGNIVGVPELIIICAIAFMALLVAWPAGRVCRKAGFSPWLGVLAIVPIASVCLLLFLAFAEWPSQRPQTGS